MTYEELLKQGEETLQKAGIDSARLDARLLLEHCTQLPREALVLKAKEKVEGQVIQGYLVLIQRREDFEPVSKIVGHKAFYDLTFMVTRDTLDPRADSETLIEAVLKHFPDTEQKLRILDLGTGTGCLLLTLLNQYPNAHGMGVDISAEALTVAFINATHLEDSDPTLMDRLDLVQTSWTQGLENEGTFDLIVSNPPYIPTSDIPTLDRDVKDHDPHLALDGGDDGMKCYDIIIKSVPPLLRPQAFLFLEIGFGQENDVTNRALDNGFHLIEWKKDIRGISRCGVFQKKD